MEICESAELIVHAGDIASVAAHRWFGSLGPPLLAVRGNVDSPELRSRLPERASFELGGFSVAVIHDSGPRPGRLNRLRRAFPTAHAVIFGHSHLPLHEADGGFQIFNPGSPTERRRAPHHSMGTLEASPGGLSFRLVEL